MNDRTMKEKMHLRPCPLLDNQGALAGMVHSSGAHSTDLTQKEDVDELTAKCKTTAENWAPVAQELWAESHPENACAACGASALCSRVG